MNIGDNAAEYDQLLKDAFLDTGDLRMLLDTNNSASVIVGRTGSGKTALLTMLTDKTDRVLRIHPENLSMQYLSNTTVIPWLLKHDVHLDVFYQLLWRHVLVMELIRDHFRLRDEEGQKSFFRRIADSISREALHFNKSEQNAMEYYRGFTPAFWEESDVRVRQITDEFSNRMAAGLQTSAIELSAERSNDHKISDEVVQRAHRVVKEISLQHIQQGLEIVKKHVLSDRQKPYYIVIDDLDKNWIEHKMSYDLIDNLLDVVGDFARIPNVKVVVALRDNIVDALHTRRGKQSQQREKHESLFLRLRWSEKDLETLVDSRLAHLLRSSFGGSIQLSSFLPSARPKGRKRYVGSGADFMFARTFRRPRDLIDFINRCVQEAAAESAGTIPISWTLLLEAEKKYSIGRLRSLEDEWHPTYPDIGRIFQCFRGMNDGFTLDDLPEDSLLDVIVGGESSTDETSLARKSYLLEEAGRSGKDLWNTLLPILYRVSFLGVRPALGSPIIYSYEGLEAVWDQVDKNAKFYIHPALHQALSIGSDT